MKQRLHKILARSTKLSLRRAEAAIAAGEVSVNGKVVTELGSLADLQKDVIRWRGRRVEPHRRNIYLIYNKPRNCIVTKSDPEGRKTIWADIKRFKEEVNAAGRLDYDSEGLIILTNDGDLINGLTHPRHEIKKVYFVKVKGFPTSGELSRLKIGLKYEGVSYRSAEVKIKSKAENNTWVEIKISEGKNRQVRNMFKAIGHPVLKLKRIQIGPVSLRGLPSSKWRFLKDREVAALKDEVGLTSR